MPDGILLRHFKLGFVHLEGCCQSGEQLHQAPSKHHIRRRRHLPEFAPDKLDERGHKPLEHAFNHGLEAIVDRWRERVEPRHERGVQTHLVRLVVDHAASTDCGRGRDLEVLRLEDHVHRRGHLDDFAAHEAQLLVVVEHGVHVFDPDGIDRPVKHNPLAVGALIGRCDAVVDRQDAVAPLIADRIVLPVQLSHGDALGIHAIDTHLVFIVLTQRLEFAEGRSQGAVAASLCAVRQPDCHQPVPNDNHFVQLNCFLAEVRRGLQIRIFARTGQRRQHVDIVGRRQHGRREEILGDALKERHVVGEKLGRIHVADCAEHQDVFRRVLERLFEVASGAQHRHNCAHAVVVVRLRRQLLAAELVRRHDLAR